MRADQYLGQIRQLKRQISRKRAESERLLTAAEGMGCAPDGDRVQSSGDMDKMAELMSRKIDCDREAESLEWASINLTHKIMHEIMGLPNPNYSLLLEMYYIQCVSISEIAEEWEKSERHIKRIKVQAVQAFSEKYPESIKKS